jgi:hypothetical protein
MESETIMNILFTQENQPNAGKLVQSLRSTGYDNYSAVADIVDNSIDAGADKIWIEISRPKNNIEMRVIDNGHGMDMKTLDEALKLGSLTDRDHTADLGRYGMGLCTASLSLCRKIEVITKDDTGKVLYSTQDVDEIVKQNRFVKYLGEADAAQIKNLESLVKNKTGTIIHLSKIDKFQNQNIEIFSNKLKKELGRIYRYFIKSGKNIFINGEKIDFVDPLFEDDKETKVYSDDEYDIFVPEKKIREKIRVKIAIIPVYSTELNRKYAINQTNQGFYILRNNREIAAGKSLQVFHKHNDLNRLRIELFFSANLDEEMGVNFAKQDIKPIQSILDKIKEEIGGQINSIRRSLIKERGTVEGDDVDHSDAEKVIAQKSKLLITPDAVVEKRKKRIERGKVVDIEKDKEKSTRENIRKVHTSPKGLGCRFELAEMGQSGPVYECYQEGKLVVIQWNSEHPFYQRMILEHKDSKNIVNSIDYFVYAMASAELKVTNDDNIEIMNNIKSIMSANIRTLLS